MIDRKMLDDLLRARKLAQGGDSLMQTTGADWDVFEKILGLIDDAVCKVVFGESMTDANMADYFNAMYTGRTVREQIGKLTVLHNEAEKTGKDERIQMPPPRFFTQAEKDAMSRTPGSYTYRRVSNGR